MPARKTTAEKKPETGTGAETDLYDPVKAFLEAQGYTVKGEVRGCDLVAVRGAEPPVVVELKRQFSLTLVLQGIDRLALSDAVYLAVPAAPRRRSRAPTAEDATVRKLCRRLGLGLLVIHIERARGRQVEVLLDPLPYKPRLNRKRRELLLGEHARRQGDHNRGGSTRVPIVTAYRQEALRCADLLDRWGPLPVAELRRLAAVPNAARIVQRDVYGWFERVERGLYRLSDGGRKGLDIFVHARPAPPSSVPEDGRVLHILEPSRLAP